VLAGGLVAGRVERPPQVGGEPLAVGLAGGPGRGLEVGVQVGLAQLAGGVAGERGRGVGRHLECAGQLVGLAAEHGGVPQGDLPVRRQGLVGPGGHDPVVAAQRRARRHGGDRRRDRGQGPARPLRLLGHPQVQHGEQVGPERLGRAGAAAELGDHLGERGVDEVVGLVAAVAGREAVDRRVVPHVERGERRFVAIACPVEQLGIGELGDSHQVRIGREETGDPQRAGKRVWPNVAAVTSARR
jgi:hypothetical protein